MQQHELALAIAGGMLVVAVARLVVEIIRIRRRE